MGASSGSEWVLPMEEKGLQGLGLRSCFSVSSLTTPANRVFPRETVPSRHRQGVVHKDGCLQWNGWEQLMEKMGAPDGKDGCLQWKFMGDSSGKQVLFYLQNPKLLSKLPLVAYVVYVMLLFMFVNMKVNMKDGF